MIIVLALSIKGIAISAIELKLRASRKYGFSGVTTGISYELDASGKFMVCFFIIPMKKKNKQLRLKIWKMKM